MKGVKRSLFVKVLTQVSQRQVGSTQFEHKWDRSEVRQKTTQTFQELKKLNSKLSLCYLSIYESLKYLCCDVNLCWLSKICHSMDLTIKLQVINQVMSNNP